MSIILITHHPSNKISQYQIIFRVHSQKLPFKFQGKCNQTQVK